MIADQILKQIELLTPPEANVFRLFQHTADPYNIYYGIDASANPVFVTPSFFPAMRHHQQSTRKLLLNTNLKCEVLIDDVPSEMAVHTLVCLSAAKDERIAFIRLTEAFAMHLPVDQPYIMNDLFSALVSLFTKEGKSSEKELQGLYSELYVIYYFLKQGINLSNYWQKHDKQNFDFSLSEIKRIEVKSTARPERIHHFKHEQLLSDLYDIVIVSLMLRKDDVGLSLLSLIEEVRSAAAGDFTTLLYIDRFIANVSDDELCEIRYDEAYSKEHVRFYRAEKIPKFREYQPDGVSHTEYDSDLSTTESFSEVEMLTWLNA